jgi:hypothetical protein
VRAVAFAQAAHDLPSTRWSRTVRRVGGPDTAQQLEEAAKDLNIGNLCAMLQFAT